jgi:hypothetical protein
MSTYEINSRPIRNVPKNEVGRKVYALVNALPWLDATVTQGVKCIAFCNAIKEMHPGPVSFQDPRYLGSDWPFTCSHIAAHANELGTSEEAILFLAAVHFK